MAGKSESKPKGKLDAYTLSENRIKFWQYRFQEEEIKEYLLTRYPQASILAEGLLDFKEILSHSCLEKLSSEDQETIKENFSDSLIPPLQKRLSVDLEAYEERYQIAQNDARFELAKRIRRKARDIQSGKETRWSAVVKNELFGSLIESSRRAEGVKLFHPRQTVERIRIEDEDTWKQGKISLKRTTPSNAPKLTAPRPDLYIALPIIRSMPNCEGFDRDDYIQNFTENNLVRLEEVDKGGLIANPLTRLYKKKGLSEKDAVCFPCAVIEIKHHIVKGKEMENCYHQAANATAAALSMLTRLSWFSIPFKSHSFREIRPVVAFTFIGHRAVVWITFVSERPSNEKRLGCCYEMQAIWKGDLRETWDTVQLCRIIENLHYWTVRHYRPWVSSCLDRWRSVVYGDDEHSKKLLAEIVESNLKEEKALQEEKYKYDSSEDSEASYVYDSKDARSSGEDTDSEYEREKFSTPNRSSKRGSPQSNRK